MLNIVYICMMMLLTMSFADNQHKHRHDCNQIDCQIDQPICTTTCNPNTAYCVQMSEVAYCSYAYIAKYKQRKHEKEEDEEEQDQIYL